MKSKYRHLLRILFPVPFILGVIGYRMAGYSFNDAFYGSFCFYFVSVYSKAFNPIMEIARWTAPLVTVSWVIVSLRGVFAFLKTAMVSSRKNSIAIYCGDNTSEAELLSSKIPHSFVESTSPAADPALISRSLTQIVFFDEDLLSLEFYNRNLNLLSKGRTHIVLRELEPSFLRQASASYFSLTKQTALDLWQKHPLISSSDPLKRSFKVAIIGDGNLSEQILSFGLMLNIYSEDQSIEYHTYGNWDIYRSLHGDMPLMNSDIIIHHDKSWQQSIEELVEMDRIIITEEGSIRILNVLLGVCRDSDIYYYSRSDENPAAFYQSERIFDFGTEAELLTADNILYSHADSMAAALYLISLDRNLHISSSLVESATRSSEWQTLLGEVKREHQLRAYFYEHYTSLIASGIPLTSDPFEIAPLEHTRWCRSRFLAFWKFGNPGSAEAGCESTDVKSFSDGSERDDGKEIYGDSAARIHKALVPFGELDENAANEELTQIIFMMHAFKNRKLK